MSRRFVLAVCALGLLSLVSMCLSGCSSPRVADVGAVTVTAGVDANGIGSVLAQPVSPLNSRAISNANNYVCGGLYSFKDAQAVDGEAAVELNGEGAVSWAIYSWSGLSIDNLPVKASYEITDLVTEYWIGIGNYSTSTWEFQGPFTGDTTDVEFTSSADYVSTSGVASLVILVAAGHAATVKWVNLVTSLGADRIHVDSSHEGVEDGSYEFPFNTIAEGAAAATAGNVVVIAPGQYDPVANITVDKVLTFEGAGAGCTHINGGFLVDVPDTEVGNAVFNGLNFQFVQYADTPGDKIPVRIQHSAILGLFISYPANHDVLLDNSVVIGDEDEDGSIVVLGDVWDVSDGVVVLFDHLEGVAFNTVSNCRVFGDIKLSMGSGATNLVSHNTCEGNIIERSGVNTTTISHNIVTNGSIFDNSGGANGVEDGIIEHNTVVEGMIRASSNSVTIRSNTVSWTTPPMFEGEAQNYGISTSSGSPTNVVDNSITIPYSAAVYSDISTIEDPTGLLHVSGPGTVSGNTITGGAYGIVDRSGADDFTGNVVTGAHYGIATSGIGDYAGNEVTGCTATGLIIAATSTAFSDNVIRDNGGDGVVIAGLSFSDQAADFGGGAASCPGGNVIMGNAGYGMVIEFDNTTVAEVFAQDNFWGETTEPLIADNCIYDGNDEAGLATVNFMPFLSTEP